MRVLIILLGCFFIVGSLSSQSHAFEIVTSSEGLPQYRFNSHELLYTQGIPDNIDVSGMLERNGVHTNGLSLARVKLIVGGKVTATFQTYGVELRNLGSMVASSQNKIFFAQNFHTRGTKWNILLTHHKNYVFKGMHVTVSR
jgi:hypothetical protein